VKSQIAAREYTARKAHRRAAIEQWSATLCDTLLDEIAREVAREAFMEQSAKRGRIRQSVRHWRDWTREREETRDAADRDRRDVWEKLRDMGLGGAARDGDAIRGESTLMGGGERMEERQVEMSLHEV
jgi:hypothetical protein